MARLLSAKRFLSSSVSLLSSSSSCWIKCSYNPESNHFHSSIKSFPLFSPPLPCSFLSQHLRSITSSSDSSPKKRPPRDVFVLPGCDFKHWLIIMKDPLRDLTRDELISCYIKTLATVVGSNYKARMKIYSVSTRYYFAFGARITRKTALKLKGVDNVRLVLPDSYLNIPNKDYGGEPFINGQPVPYHRKYHAMWVSNREWAKRYLIEEAKQREQNPRPSFLPGLRMTAEEVERRFEALEKKQNALKPAEEKIKPKRHTPVFRVFMEDFRKTYKEEHPENKSVVEVEKEGSKKWKTLTDEEKKQYFDRAAERIA